MAGFGGAGRLMCENREFFFPFFGGTGAVLVGGEMVATFSGGNVIVRGMCADCANAEEEGRHESHELGRIWERGAKSGERSSPAERSSQRGDATGAASIWNDI